MRRIIGFSICIFLVLVTGNAFPEALRRGKVTFWSDDTDVFPYKRWVYIMNADGSDLTKLMDPFFEEGGEGFGVAGVVSLSPDCRKATFMLKTSVAVGQGGFRTVASDIAVIDLDSHEIVNLTNGELKEGCRYPRWSPFGDQIVFNDIGMIGGLTRYIYMMNSDGSNIRMIGEGRKPDWSRNGKIAFVRNRDIYTMNADGDNVKKIARSPKPSVNLLRWSPDAKRILFTTYGNWDIDRIYIMDSDGENLKLIHEGARKACWSPDGKKIAFVRVEDEDDHWHGKHLWLMDPDGGDLERLTDNERGGSHTEPFDWRDPVFTGIAPLLDAAKATWGAIKTQVGADD